MGSPKDDFSSRLASLCAARGIGPSRLAELAGADISRTSRWLRGLSAPRNRAAVVHRALGMTLAEFYGARLPRRRVA